jgi:hypothetical protein
MVLSLLGAWLGLPGIGFGTAVLIWHLHSLRTMGMRYLKIRNAPRRGVLRHRLVEQKYRNRELKPLDDRNQK